MPPLLTREEMAELRKPKCKACGGTGKNSRGLQCICQTSQYKYRDQGIVLVQARSSKSTGGGVSSKKSGRN